MVKNQASPADTQKAERGERILAGKIYQREVFLTVQKASRWPEARESWREAGE